jgi:hypothetical protein
MAEWPDYGTQAQLGKHWRKQIQYVFFDSIHLAQRAEFAPENPARS